MIKQRIVRAALGIALIAASSVAAAESTAGWYFGATGGQTQADFDKASLDSYVENEFAMNGFPIVSGTSTLDDSDSSWSIVAGYRFSPNFSLEGSYIDLGAGEYRASGLVNPPGPVFATPASYTQS